MRPPARDLSPETLRTFSRLSAEAGRTLTLDDQTWSDLDMDAVAARIDRTVSTPGRMVFDRILRAPLVDSATLTERDGLIEALAPQKATTESWRRALGALDRRGGAEGLMRLLWDDPPSRMPNAWAHRLLAILAVLSIPLALFVGKLAVFAPFLALAVNGAIHFRARILWQGELQALRYVGALRVCARKVQAIPTTALVQQQRRLAEALRDTDAIARHLSFLSSGGFTDILYEYVNAFLLLELRAYDGFAREWPGATPALRELFVTLGEVDALASVAVWRAELPTWSRPDLAGGAAALELEEGVHPLLEASVPNSMTLGGLGCLITGANMSGKSTLLRVVGINALLAQTVFTCTARRYRATPLRIISSMRVGDALLEGKSRYLAEAERLLVLVRLADEGSPALCLIDELLSGTNTTERLATSRAILGHLARSGMLVLAATHDLELAEHLVDRYESLHFADDFSRDDLRFDHRLRKGVATNRNAIQLLERLGYPEEILSEARGAE